MQIRPITPADAIHLETIDGTIESADFLHLERVGEGLSLAWRTEQRPLRNRYIARNLLDDETRLALRHIATGVEEGILLAAEHENTLVASLIGMVDPARNTVRLLDLRVDADFRRQGLGSALLFRCIQDARDRKLRAVAAATTTINVPAAMLFSRTGFDLAGFDSQFCSNHDLVKEMVTLFWYAALD